MALAAEANEPSDRGPREFDRTPPQNIAAEQSVLGGMLLSKDAIADVVEALRPTDFYRPAHQIICEAILDLYGRGEPADAITVSAELIRNGNIARVGGANYLHTLMSSVPTAANAGYYAEIVAEQAILRRLVEAGTRIVQMGYGAAGGSSDITGTVDEVVDRAQAEVYDVTERRSTEDYVVIESLLQNTLDEIERIESNGGVGTGIPTGFHELDQLTNGLHPGQMITIAGTTWFWQGVGVGHAAADPGRVDDDGRRSPSATYSWVRTESPRGSSLRQMSWSVARATRSSSPTARSSWPTRSINGVPVLSWSKISAIDTYAMHASLGPQPVDALGRRSAAANAGGYPRGALGTAVRSRISRPTKAVPVAGTVTTEQIAATLRCPTADQRLNHSVDCAEPLNLPTAELLIPPYTLGAWLGDRTSAAKRLTSADPQILDNFRVLGVLGDKHIPTEYLRADESQRRALLAGLLDTDGYATQSGSVVFSVTSRRLAEDVFDLVVGLGYRAAVTTKPVRGCTPASSIAYSVSFTPGEKVFGLDRKADRQVSQTRSGTRFRYVVDVRPIASVSVRCVQVDNDDHMYLAGRAMIPTHNSTLALDIARSSAIKHGKPTAMFSLEMGKLEIMMRLFSAEARGAAEQHALGQDDRRGLDADGPPVR